MVSMSFDTEKFFTSTILGFVVIQVLSWLLHEYVGETFPLIKGGWIIILILLVVFIVTLFVMGRKVGTLKREDYLFVGLVGAVIIIAFWALPKYVPQIFSSSGLEVGNTIKQTMNSIFNIGG